jgi:hypothetical protein
MSGWKPIETAPKDGTRVDLWLNGNQPIGRQTNCYYANGVWRFDFGDMVDLPVETHSIKADYWMPLPAPPEDTP